jgi:PIN domain nuclease of toxin-antitoxin system
VKLLLDTHILVWFWLAPERLPPGAAEALADGATELLTSAATGWEIAIKVHSGRWPEARDLLPIYEQSLLASAITEVPISSAHGRVAASFTSPHRDPFDRMIAAHTIATRSQLVTVDTAMQTFGISLFNAQVSP